MQRGTDREAEALRQRRVDGRVAGAARDDDIRLQIDGALEGLHAHLADDAGGAVDIRLRECADGADGRDLAAAHGGLHDITRHLGANIGDLEAQIVLARDFADDVHGLGKVRIAAARAGRAENEGNAVPDRTDDREAEIPLGRAPRRRELACAEIVGARIDRAHVSADQMRLAREAGAECRFGNAIAELSGGREDAQRTLLALPGVDGGGESAHISRSRMGRCCWAP